jgi:hypothetical protein
LRTDCTNCVTSFWRTPPPVLDFLDAAFHLDSGLIRDRRYL